MAAVMSAPFQLAKAYHMDKDGKYRQNPSFKHKYNNYNFEPAVTPDYSVFRIDNSLANNYYGINEAYKDLNYLIG